MKRATFVPPSVAEVKAYADEIGFRALDAEQFVDHYETIGWVVGKHCKPMRDWRAAVRNWRRMQKQWGIAREETDPIVQAYAREARQRLAAGGYEIGRFWSKVRDAIGPDGLERVKALSRKGGA